MKKGKKSAVIRSCSVLAILVYGGLMLHLGEGSIFDVFSVFFYPFILIFGELLVIKTYGLCAKEMKARTVIHTVSSAMIAVPAIILLCLDFTEFVKRGSFWRHYPLAVFCLDAIAILIVITVFKRRKKSEVN